MRLLFFFYTGLVPIRVLSYHDLPDFWGVHFLAVVCVCVLKQLKQLKHGNFMDEKKTVDKR